MDPLTLGLAGFANVTAIIRMEFEAMSPEQRTRLVDARVDLVIKAFELVQTAKSHLADLNAKIAAKVHDAFHGNPDASAA